MPTGLYLDKKRVAVGVALIILILFGSSWRATTVPPFALAREAYRPSDVWIYDRYGEPVELIRRAQDRRSLPWISLREISPAVRDLLIRAEDRRFDSHIGVDLLALAHAAWDGLHGRPRGASTLTMQLAQLLGNDFGQGLMRKLRQIVAALKIESQWTKDEILEAYLNLTPFRGELRGLPAASRGLFGKMPAGLNQDESALLVALLRSPNAPVARVARRACELLRGADCREVARLAGVTLSRPYRLDRDRETIPVLASGFIERRSSDGGIHTSLDRRTQEFAMGILREQLRHLERQNVHDGSVLVLETNTGRVVAYAANGGGSLSSAAQIDGVRALRQAGSTLKPFVYGTAFDWRLLTPASLLLDSPADIPVGDGRVYNPKNYDHTFRGLVGAAEALGSSLNVPAVRALGLVGEARVLERMRRAGFTNLRDDDYYGPSLALGTVDVSLWELTQAYRQIATNNQVFTAPTRLALRDILASPEYRRLTFGTGGVLALPFPAAVKTGTSKDMRDNWCVGWTDRFTVGVWVGNFDGSPMWQVSGLTGAAPIWRALMLALHPEPTRWTSTYTSPNMPLPERSLTRIRYPPSGMRVGVDPDIPLAQQKLPIEIENPQAGHRLFLNDRPVKTRNGQALWEIRRGKYMVKLKDRAGKTVDAVDFEVR